MIENAIKALHQHPAHGYLCITGGGASGLSKLLAEPGASSTILGADIPIQLDHAEQSIGWHLIQRLLGGYGSDDGSLRL